MPVSDGCSPAPGCVDVDVEQDVPVLVGHLFQRPGALAADASGIVDKDRDRTAGLGFDLTDPGGAGGAVAQVHHLGGDAAVRRGLRQFSGGDVGGEHAGAEVREGLCDAPAEAVSRAGHFLPSSPQILRPEAARHFVRR